MNAYVIKAGVMAWPKIKSVLIYAMLVALGYIATQLEQWIIGTNFGSYQSIVLLVNGTLFKFIQKWFTDHGVVVQD